MNTASRMEASGVPGQIQVTAGTYELIKDMFACEPRGPVELKGKRTMETYLRCRIARVFDDGARRPIAPAQRPPKNVRPGELVDIMRSRLKALTQ